MRTSEEANANPVQMSRNQIQHEIDLRYAQIDRLHGEIAFLRTRNNSLSPISRLSPEVLGEVLIQLMRSYDLRDIWEGPGDEAPDAPANVHEWLVVCQVCRYWRDVAISTPRLWGRIVFTQTEDRVNAFLERSGNILLSFEPRQHSKLSYEQAKMVFARFASRTKSIDGLSLGHNFAKRLARAEVPSILPLESLDIEVTTDRLDSFAPLSDADMPRLKILRCARASGLLMQSLLRPTLTELAVEDISTLINVSDWIMMLRNLSGLTRLKLYKAVSSQTPSGVASRYPRPHVRLEHLRSLYLFDVDAGHGCAELLEQLLVPDVVDLRFYTTSLALTQNPPHVLKVLGKHIAGANMIDFPRSFNHMSLDDASELGLAFAMGGHDGTLHLSFPYDATAQDTWLQHTVRCFLVSHVTHLAVRAFRDVDTDAWVNASSAFLGVTRLTLGDDPNLHVLEALTNDGFLPNLSELVLARCSMNPETLHTLNTALSYRKMCGLNLARLDIRYEAPHEELRNLMNVAGQVSVHAL